jgi:fructokinase
MVEFFMKHSQPVNTSPLPVHLGIDLGGTKIEIVALDPAGRELMRERVATPQGDYRATLLAVVELVRSAEARLRRQGTVGIGTPGALSNDNRLLKNSNSICLIGRPFLEDLEQMLDRPIRLENDANCFALSEATDGSASGSDVVFGAILGTGVGGGIVVHNRVLTGPNSIAGEWGHNPLPWPNVDELPGPPCYCGKKGCIETFLSGPGFAADHAVRTGESIDPKTIAERAAGGDMLCRQTVSLYENRLARSLAVVINVLDPDVIVLGGGMSNIDSLYENVPRLWRQYVFSDLVVTRLLAAKHGDSSGVRGAAWLGRA